MASNVNIARLNTIVTANAVQFRNELGQAGRSATDFGKVAKTALGSLGTGLSIAGVIAFGRSLLDLGREITNMAEAAGIAPEKFQQLSVFAMNAGVSMSEVSRATAHMREELEKANEKGSNPLNEGLRKLNLTAAGLLAIHPEEAWQILGERISVATDKQAAYNIVAELFSQRLAPRLKTTLEEMAKGADHAAAATQGLIIKDEDLKKLDEFANKSKQMWLAFKVGAVESATGVSAVFENFMNGLNAARAAQAKKNNAAFFAANPDSIFTPGPTFLSDAARKRGLDPINNPTPNVPSNQADIERRMSEANAAPKEFWKDLQDKLDSLNKSKSMLSLFFGEDDARQKNNMRPELGVNTSPTDSFSRIGLMTGVVTNPEQKHQTSLLSNIHEVLQRINQHVAASEGAAFAN